MKIKRLVWIVAVLLTVAPLFAKTTSKTLLDAAVTFYADFDPPTLVPVDSTTQSGDTVAPGTYYFKYFAFDSIAGLMKGSTVFTAIVYHSDSTADTFDIADSLSMFALLVSNDSLVVSITVCDSIVETVCSCEPNCSTYTYTYYSAGIGPIVSHVSPPQDATSACSDQSIEVLVTDPHGVDSTTIIFVVEGETLTTASDMLSFSNDTLTFSPPAGFWTNGATIHYGVIAADDLRGNALQAPMSWSFFVDLEPPVATMTSPVDTNVVWDRQQSVSIHFSDNFSAIDLSASTFTIQNISYTLSTLAPQFSIDTLSGSFVFNPQNFSTAWLPGDTVRMIVDLSDVPDICDANEAEYRFAFILPENPGCVRIPNPFTPNGDGKNDYVQFEAPGVGYEIVTISIYNIYSMKLIQFDIPTGAGAKAAARWFGVDSDGNRLSQGLYLYVIESEGEIVCKGTVTISR
jgi:gliding motility-associated-like protein